MSNRKMPPLKGPFWTKITPCHTANTTQSAERIVSGPQRSFRSMRDLNKVLTVRVIVVQLNIDTRWAVRRQTKLCVLKRDVTLCEFQLQLLSCRHLVPLRGDCPLCPRKVAV